MRRDGLGHNHQALACGYSVSGSEVTMQVYDPNSGQDDDVHISFDASAPTTATDFSHNLNLDWPVRGFFLTGYSPVTPPLVPPVTPPLVPPVGSPGS